MHAETVLGTRKSINGNSKLDREKKCLDGASLFFVPECFTIEKSDNFGRNSAFFKKKHDAAFVLSETAHRFT